MKHPLLLAAILSGLCAEAVAAPISQNSRYASILSDYAPGSDSPLAQPAIPRDLEFNTVPAPETLPEDRQSEPGPTIFSASIPGGVAASLFHGKEPGLAVPEPTSFSLSLVVLGCAAIFVLCRRARQIGRHSRRRCILRIRALTLLQ